SRGRERRAEWIKGVMVHPDHRNGPIGFLLIKELMTRLTFPLSLVVGKPARRLFGALGMAEVGTILNYICPLNPGAILEKLDLEATGMPLPRWISAGVRLAQRTGLATTIGACAGCALRLRTLITSKHTRALRSDSPDVFPVESDLDGLWHLMRGEIEAAPVRNARYMKWRYG